MTYYPRVYLGNDSVITSIASSAKQKIGLLFIIVVFMMCGQTIAQASAHHMAVTDSAPAQNHCNKRGCYANPNYEAQMQRHACASDFHKYCPGMQADASHMGRCLNDHRDEVTADCANMVGVWCPGGKCR